MNPPVASSLSSLSLLCAADIANQRFAKLWRGYDPPEVERFLGLVAEQTACLTERLRVQEIELQQRDADLLLAQRQGAALQDALRIGDREAAQIRQAARRDADALLGDAKVQAAKTVDAAQSTAQQLTEQIVTLRQLRQQLLEDLRGVVSTHERLLDVMESSVADEQQPSDPAVIHAAPRKAPAARPVQLGAPPPPGN